MPYFGDLTISQLDQPTVDGFVAAELRGRSVKTVNNRLAVLSTLIKYVTGDKPRLRFKIAGMTGEMSAVATDDVEKILAVAGPRDRAAVPLADEAGLRAGEIRGLQWGDVRDGQITVRGALDNETNEVIAPKHNKARTVPLSPRILAALAALPRRGMWVIAAGDGGAVDYDRAGARSRRSPGCTPGMHGPSRRSRQCSARPGDSGRETGSAEAVSVDDL